MVPFKALPHELETKKQIKPHTIQLKHQNNSLQYVKEKIKKRKKKNHGLGKKSRMHLQLQNVVGPSKVTKVLTP